MPKKSSKKTSKNTKPSKKTTKTVKKVIVKKYYINENINKVILDNMIKNSNAFGQEDVPVFEILRSYKNIYDMIIHKSLDYDIKVSSSNITTGTTNVEYYQKVPYYAGPYRTTMHIIGYLNGNTFTWNKYTKQDHYYTYLSTLAPLIKNNTSLLTLEKIFNYNQITFSERYKNIIPYLLSYMYDPKKANIIRFVDVNGYYTYIFITLSLNIPYWYQITDYIVDEMNRLTYIGGSSKITGTSRLLKDDDKSHKNQKFTSKIPIKIDEINKQEKKLNK